MRILVVEDEPVAAAVLAKGLREHAYAVDVAVDGDGAFEQGTVNDYDLMIVDVLLPGMNGLELCSRLRADGVTAPILMLTARGEPDQRVQGLDAGADDYLPKPYHFPELLARVRALLRRGPAFQSVRLQLACGRYVELISALTRLRFVLGRRRGNVYNPLAVTRISVQGLW